MSAKYQTIEEVQSAVESGKRVFWNHTGYEVKKSIHGEWFVVCYTGFSSPLVDGHIKDLFSNEQ